MLAVEGSNGGTAVISAQANGKVGIGNTSPTEKLDVTGNVKVTGNVTATGTINAKYQDVAEWVDSPQQLAIGTVVVLDSTRSNQAVAATQAYDSRVAGVISTNRDWRWAKQARDACW